MEPSELHPSPGHHPEVQVYLQGHLVLLDLAPIAPLMQGVFGYCNASDARTIECTLIIF